MFESMKALADALQEQYASLASAGPDTMSLVERAERLADCQRAINSLSAIQDLDMARLAATERVPCEDGTSRDVMHALGSMRLDAAALTSGSLQVSDAVARRRVDNAVWLCTVGRPALDAKGEGRLDEFRASILAEELADADADTTTAVLERIDDHLGEETSGLLRRRTRRVLSRIDPDAVHRQAAAAKSERRLERWAGEPGMNRWYASLPADQARTTDPVDHLDLEPPSQLKRPAPPPPPPPSLPPPPAEPTSPECRFRSPDYFSRVEYALEHHLKRVERARRRARHGPRVRVIHVETPPF